MAKVQNPSAVQPWYGQAFGTWYSIEPGGSIDVDNAEVASCLGAMGCLVDDTRKADTAGDPRVAVAVESPSDAAARAAAQAANAKSASVPASVADEVAMKYTQVTAGPEVAADLKGSSLDDALGAAGLSKSGTADEKRARYAEWVDQQGAAAEAGAAPAQVGDADTSGDQQ